MLTGPVHAVPRSPTAAVAAKIDGFDVLALAEDRRVVEKSHAQGDRRREKDELLHLQLLDLALLSQADVIAGVFGSTFVKTALQLGRAASYVTLDTFPWCPLLRCYWGWRDMCHNCELCYNGGGGGEACNTNGYHTAGGLPAALRDSRPVRGAFRRFMQKVADDFKCRAFADHPLETSMYDAPVVGSAYAPKLLLAAGISAATLLEVCVSHADGAAQPDPKSDGATHACACGFRRFPGVDNAAAASAKPAYGYAHGVLRQSTFAALPSGQAPTLSDCEAACCKEPLCHSITWRANTSTCIAALAIAHGARQDDWCWHPTSAPHATTSIRRPGMWQAQALREAAKFLAAHTLIRTGPAAGPRVFTKRFSTPVGHSHPMERELRDTSCKLPLGAVDRARSYAISDVVAAAIPVIYGGDTARSCPSELHPHKLRMTKGGEVVWGTT